MLYVPGDLVYSKRNGQKATVIQPCLDGSMHVELEGTLEQRHLTKETVRRWWRRVDMTPKDVKKVSEMPPLPKGEKGIGTYFFNWFYSYVRQHIPDGDDFSFHVNPRSNVKVFRLNGKNIFEVTYSSYRFSVLVNYNHLTPEQRKAAYYTYPKTHNWALRTRFVFTSKEQKPLLIGVINSAIYGRTRVHK